MQRLAVLLLGLSLAYFSATPAQAAYSFGKNSGLDSTAGKSGYETGTGDEVMTLSERVGQAVGVVISLVGVLFLGLVIYGGFKWMTARGNDNEVAAAKKLVEQAVIGLIVVLAAYAITQFIGYETGQEAWVTE